MNLSIETSWPAPELWPNSRKHRMQVYGRQRAAKDEAFWATRAAVPPGTIHDGSAAKLTIYAHPPTVRDRDDDNLIAACKAYRDGIAMALAANDKCFEVQPVQWGEKNNRGGLLVFTLETAEG